MAHKTITISEEAYNALARMKKENESFTDVILRIASKKGDPKALLEFLEKMGPSEDLANSIEEVMKRTRKARLTRVKLD
jgi:predicted CopG family antitoxin